MICLSHRIHGAAIYGNMDPINIPLYVSIYTSTMDHMGIASTLLINQWASGKRTNLSSIWRCGDIGDIDQAAADQC